MMMSIESREEVLRLFHDIYGEWTIGVIFVSSNESARVVAAYQDGDIGVQIVDWSATYESPLLGDSGHAALGSGRIDLEVEQLRGIGLGSLLMQPLISWIKSRSATVPVMNINLAGPDARTEAEKRRRNRFYEKLGFQFDYKDDETHGVSIDMTSDKLIIPPFQLSRGWKVESIGNAGEVFCQ